jgi:hypothetical protein
MLPPFSGVATSQSTVDNNQVQSGDVLSTQTLNVVDTTGASTSIATATGNSLNAGTEAGSLDVQTVQTGNVASPGNVTATSHVFVTTNAGSLTTVNASATANTVEADSVEGGPLTGNFTQSTIPNITVKSEYDFNAAAAQTGAASVSSQAIGNSLGFGLSDASSNVTTNQTNNATIDAEGGSEVGGGSGATLQYTPGTAAFSATAVANNLTATGTGVSSQTINTTQTASGPLVQAGNFANVGNGQTIEGDATATANNVAISNQGGALVVNNTQTNSSGDPANPTFVFADSVASGFEFGSGQATADGVGNSVLAGNQGPSTELNNVQVNNSGIEANASFTGDNGFDATSSATAMGNAAIGFACSQCGGVINVTNSQTTSGGGVEAFSSTTTNNTTGSNRSTTGISTAVGNSATFYVSKPTN